MIVNINCSMHATKCREFNAFGLFISMTMLHLGFFPISVTLIMMHGILKDFESIMNIICKCTYYQDIPIFP